MDIITLINKYVSGLLNTEEKFLEHLDSLTTFEETVSRLSNQMTADFIGLILTDADRMIRGSGFRKGSYTVQRSRQRTLISSVGDITFTHILYKDKSGKIRCLLDELIRLPDRERFTAVATGTDGMIDAVVRKKYTAKQKEAYRYAERIHATLGERSTVNIPDGFPSAVR